MPKLTLLDGAFLRDGEGNVADTPSDLPGESSRTGLDGNNIHEDAHLSHNLNSLKGSYIWDYIGDCYRGY